MNVDFTIAGDLYTNSGIDFQDISTSTNSIIFRGWSFGDKKYANGASISHIFTGPGIYTIKLNVIDSAGVSSSLTKTITVVDYIKERLKFSRVPAPVEQGVPQAYPFSLSLSAADFSDHYVTLYSQGSKSAPTRTSTRWSGLQPQWRFLDTNFTPVTSIKTNDTIVYKPDTTERVGVTGTAEFYYVDDIPSSGQSVTLWATLNKEDGTNSLIRTSIPYYIESLVPKTLFFTEDLVNEIYPIKWSGSNIPHLITLRGHSYTQQLNEYPIIFDFPTTTGQFVSAGPLSRSLLNCPASSYTFEGGNIVEFQRRSIEGYDTGGYIKTNVAVDCDTLNTAITGEMQIVYRGTPRFTPFVWIPNPLNGAIIKLNSIINSSNDIVATITNVPVTTLSNTVTSNSSGHAFGHAGIYGVAVDPLYNAWVTDSELDRIYKIDTQSNIVQTISLSAIIVDTNFAPASICLDGDLNVYVALCNKEVILKLDKQGDFISFVVIPNNVPALSGAFVAPQNNEIETIIPTFVETDSANNIWVGYSRADFKALIKYNSAGEYLAHILLDALYQPTDLVIDAFQEDSFWVALSHSYDVAEGMLNKYTRDGTLITSIHLADPYYVTQDVVGDIWATSGNNKIVHLKPNGDIDTITISPGLAPNVILEGIAGDSYNNIWALDSEDNRAIIIDRTTYAQKIIKILPDGNFEFYDDNGNYAVSNISNTSIQALGDWTGFRWNQKYAFYRVDGTRVITLTGASANFNIYKFKDNNDIRKFNESFDIMKYIKELPMPETLSENTVLFDNFLGSAIGGLETNDQSVGRIVYERIANYVANNQDIDTCGISQLYSMANKLDVTLDDYNLAYPSELKRIMDIISIPHSRLWGIRSKNENKFADSFSCCDDCKPVNRGNPLNYNTSLVTAGTKIVAKSNYLERYIAIPIIEQNSLSTYPLSALEVGELDNPIGENYTFYQFIHVYDNKQVEGVINWDDPYTTLKESNSGLDTWYGDKNKITDEGIIEEILNYSLHKGLGLIKD